MTNNARCVAFAGNLLSLFYAGGTSSNMLSQHLVKYSLQFNKKDFEDHYYKFVNRNAVVSSIIICTLVIVIFLAYLGLDISYDRFHDLMLSRVITAGILFLTMVVFTISRNKWKYEIYKFVYFGCIVSIVSAMLSLIFREDISCSPLFMMLLWCIMYILAPFFLLKTIMGTILIVSHTFVWLFVLDMSPVNFFNTQALNYALFFLGLAIAAYGREIMHRKTYLQTHIFLSSIDSLRSHATSLTPISPISSLSSSSSPSPSPSSYRHSVFISIQNTAQISDAVQKEILHHKEIGDFMKKNSNRFTLHFNDSEKEKKFSEWQLQETLYSLRRFLLLNIISFAFCVTHDLSFDLSSEHRHVLFALRFGIIMPSFLASFFLSLSNKIGFSKWRRIVISVLEIIVSVTTITTGVYLHNILATETCEGDNCLSVHAWNLYCGSAVRIIIYGFSGMGLMWANSFVTTLIILIYLFGVTIPYGIFALSPLMLIIIGFGVAYFDEKVRRTDYYLTFHSDELLRHLTEVFSQSDSKFQSVAVGVENKIEKDNNNDNENNKAEEIEMREREDGENGKKLMNVSTDGLLNTAP